MLSEKPKVNDFLMITTCIMPISIGPKLTKSDLVLVVETTESDFFAYAINDRTYASRQYSYTGIVKETGDDWVHPFIQARPAERDEIIAGLRFARQNTEMLIEENTNALKNLEKQKKFLDSWDERYLPAPKAS